MNVIHLQTKNLSSHVSLLLYKICALFHAAAMSLIFKPTFAFDDDDNDQPNRGQPRFGYRVRANKGQMQRGMMMMRCSIRKPQQ